MGGSPKTLKKNTEASVVASKETGLEVNADKTWYMVMSRDQNVGQSHSMNIDNRSLEMVEELKYLGTTLTYQHSIQEEIKSRLKPGNVCYNSVQNPLLSSLLFKNLKSKVHIIIMLPAVLHGCETWSFTLREERTLKVSENRVLRSFGSKRGEVTRGWRENYIIRSLTICTPHPILFV